MINILLTRDCISLALVLAGSVWFFRHAITDRTLTLWRSMRTRFLPTGQQDNAKLIREYREGTR
ncbi:MAG: hypothetical protein WCH98_09225 [Verrucomicrobiota bacterium]